MLSLQVQPITVRVQKLLPLALTVYYKVFFLPLIHLIERQYSDMRNKKSIRYLHYHYVIIIE